MYSICFIVLSPNFRRGKNRTCVPSLNRSQANMYCLIQIVIDAILFSYDMIITDNL